MSHRRMRIEIGESKHAARAMRYFIELTRSLLPFSEASLRLWEGGRHIACISLEDDDELVEFFRIVIPEMGKHFEYPEYREILYKAGIFTQEDVRSIIEGLVNAVKVGRTQRFFSQHTWARCQMGTYFEYCLSLIRMAIRESPNFTRHSFLSSQNGDLMGCINPGYGEQIVFRFRKVADGLYLSLSNSL
jgi:hypothetical protein